MLKYNVVTILLPMSRQCPNNVGLLIGLFVVVFSMSGFRILDNRFPQVSVGFRMLGNRFPSVSVSFDGFRWFP